MLISSGIYSCWPGQAATFSLYLLARAEEDPRGKGRIKKEECHDCLSALRSSRISVSSNTLVPQRLKCLGRDDRRIDEQLQPVCCLLDFAQGIAAFRDKFIRSSPTRSPLP